MTLNGKIINYAKKKTKVRILSNVTRNEYIKIMKKKVIQINYPVQ
jgi:hypothetical protein